MRKAKDRPQRLRKPSKKAWINTVDKRYKHRYGIVDLIRVSGWSVLFTICSILLLAAATGGIR